MDNKNDKTQETNSITCTVIFDGSALNRDEKIGNNVLSIKKLTYQGEIRPFISKNAIRHYLFNTLKIVNNWKESDLAQGKEVIQFDVLKDNILTSPELDAFGYMYTGEKTLTRKSPVGITKAIALNEYNQDMGFYSNHDLVRRSREQGLATQPNLFSKEEFMGLFKVSFTIDSDKLGKDFIIVESIDDSNEILTLALVKPEVVVLDNVMLDDEKEGSGDVNYKYNNETITVIGNRLTIPKSLFKKNKSDISLQVTPDLTFEKPNEENNDFKFQYSELNRNKKELMITLDDGQIILFKSVSEKNEISIGKGKAKENLTIIINDDEKTVLLPKGLFEVKEEQVTVKKDLIKSNTFFKTELSEEEIEAIGDNYTYELNKEPQYDEGTKKLKLEKGITILFRFKKKQQGLLINQYCENPIDYETEEGHRVHIEQIKGKNKFQAHIHLSFQKKQERIKQILQAIKNGIVAHSSGEDNTIKPLFILAAAVKVPMPAFHGDIDVKKEDDVLKVIGIKNAIDNGWLNGNIYLQVNERLSAPAINDDRIITDWGKFLKAVNLETTNNEGTES